MAIRLNDLETLFRLRLDNAVRGLDQTIDKIGQAEKATKSLQDKFDSLGNAGKKLAIGGAAITASLGFAAKAADEQRVLYDGLRATVEATGNSFSEQEPKIMEFLNGLQATSRFGDTDFIPTFNRILLATGSVEDAMRGTRIAANLASAGFGKMASTGNTLAQVFEGNVESAAKFIPILRDTTKLLKEGATRAELSELALSKLEGVSDNFPPPTGVNLYTKSLGDLQEAIGDVVLDGLDPLLRKMNELNMRGQELAKSDFGRLAIIITGIGGALALVGGALLIFIGQAAQSILVLTGAGGLTAAFKIAIGAAAKLGLAVGSASALSVGLIAVAAAVAIAIVELNKLSKALDTIDEGIRRSDNLPKFKAEAAALAGTIKQLEAGLLSAAEAEEEFTRFGIAGVDQAETRVAVLDRIVDRLERQRDLEREIADQGTTEAPAFDLDAGDFEDSIGGQVDTIERTIKALNKEEGAIRSILFQFDEGSIKAGEAATKLQELGFASREAAQGRLVALEEELGGLERRRDILAAVRDLEAGSIEKHEIKIEQFKIERTLLSDIHDEEGNLIPPITEQISLVQDVNAEWEVFKKNVGASIAPSTNLTKLFQSRLPGIASTAGKLGFALGESLITGVNDSAEALGAFFKQLLIDLGKAIVEALILQGILSTIGGPVGGFIGGLFQNPLLDQLARFEGTRFLDLFSQGLVGAMQQQVDSGRLAELSGSDIRERGGSNINIMVEEATPETWIRIADEEIEPRVRELGAQRTGVPPSQGNFR